MLKMLGLQLNRFLVIKGKSTGGGGKITPPLPAQVVVKVEFLSRGHPLNNSAIMFK